MRFISRNSNFKIPLHCTDGITHPQYRICKKQNTGTKLNKSISSAHSILPQNAFNSSNDHDNFVHYLVAWGLPLIDWYPMLKNTRSVQERNLISNLFLQISFYRNESPLKLYWKIVSHFSYKVSFFLNITILLY